MPSRIVLRPIGIAVAVVCCAFALGSCGDDGSSPPSEATAVVALAGDGQQAEVGATLPIELVARATDARGRPVAGQAVTWSVASGGGSLANASAETDADGLARATWTLGTVAGQQAVSVGAGSAPAATFTATALAGPAQSLEIVPAAVGLDAIGATQALTVSAADAYGNAVTGRPVTWVSLDEAVAVVSAAGVVQAVGNGATKVRATLDGAAAEVDVVVAQVAALVQVAPAAPVLAALGETVQLTATALDGNGNPLDAPSLSWTSSNDAVATVDASGVVTARGDGTATITASLGEVSGEAIVTVAREAAAVIVAPETATLRPGETVQLSAEVRDAAGNRIESAAVDWSTSDADVVTVDASGLVTAVADGTATITATSGEASGHATITVVSTKPPRANDDAAAGSSAPGDAFHTAFNTALNGPSGNTPSLLANDDLGDPAATIVSFGGGSLPGNAGTHAAGSSVAGAGGSITVNADGTFTFTPALGFTGLFTFAYRLSNSAGSDDAQVTIAVGSRLIAAAPDNYQAATGHVLIGNVPINTATGTPFSVLANDTGEGIIAVLEGTPVNGQVTLNDDGTFTLTPDPGFRNGSVTFQYRVENGFGQSAPVTVTVPVGPRAIWFVDNSKASNGDGRQNSPFTCTLGCLDVSAPGDVIFLHSGSGPYDGGLVLQDDQHVIGQGATVPLATAAGLTVPPHSTLPATGSARPKFEGDIGVAQNNTLRGFDITSAIGIAIAGGNFGTLTISEMDLSAPTHAMLLSGGTLAATFGTLTVTHSWQGFGGMLLTDVDGSLSATTTTITGTDGPAVSLSNTALTLSLGTVTLAPMDGFEGIFADNSSGMISTAGGTITTTNAPALYISGPLSRTPLDLTLTAINVDGGSNGVVLDLTSGPGLTVTGSGAPGSGGTIQNLTDAGILLARTENVSFSNMVIQNTARNGIFGEAVENFTLTSSTIANTGSQPDDANIRFYRGDWPAPLFSGTVTITGNTLSSPFARNIDIDNQTGTITELVISNNVLANTDGEGIRIRARGDFNPPGQILRATIDNNQITTSNATGLVVDCYNDSAAGTPEVRCGLPGSGTDVFMITNNMISGAGPGASLEVGLSAIAFGATRANFHIAGNEILHTTGDALYHQATGAAEVTTTINGNTIVANNAAGAAGINVTTDYPFHPAGNSPVVSVTISNNDVSQTDGSGIVAAALRGSGTLNLRIQNNTVAAPLSGSRPGIRIDSGNADSINETLCLNISGNTSAGSGAALGIGLHKEGTLPGVNAFRIHGMAATATPDVEAYVNGLNPNANGTFLMSATSGFGNCNLP